MPIAFVKFEITEDVTQTIIHARSMAGQPIQLAVNHCYDKCQQALWNYNQGDSLQQAFPFFTPDEREFMITGIGPQEWDELFPEDADE